MPSGKRPIYIGVAWPYANGPLHLGHVAGSLLPPDIFRRGMRMMGHPVLMVSGSDCHGTPIMIKAEKEGRTPAEVVAHYHGEHRESLRRLGIDFSLFTTTTTENHRKWVQDIFLACREMGFIEERTQKAPYDAKAGRFLPDRYVEGTCPHCKQPGARGDQCDSCGKTLDPQELIAPVSKMDPGNPVTFRDTKHFFFLLSKLQGELERYVASTAAHWRANTVNFTSQWLKDGLQDRPITRDLTWGVPIPLEGYGDKRIYVWFEAVCGYLSASVEWAERQGKPEAWQAFWTDSQARGYYFLGKDNIPFHTIIWPAILLAYNKARSRRGEPELNLPFDVPANEFLNLAGLKFSKSQGVGIGVQEVLDRFEPDAVRYYLSINMPEQKDADWTWEDFLSKVNDELVGAWGNLANRVLSFTKRNVGAVPPAPPASDALARKVQDAIEATGDEAGLHLATVNLRKAMRRVMDLAQQGNQWMQEAAPWATWKADPDRARHDLHSLLRVCKALAVYSAPFLPHASQRLWEQLGEQGSVHDQSWSAALQPLPEGRPLPDPQPLVRKLDADAVKALAGPAAGAAADGKEAAAGRRAAGQGAAAAPPAAGQSGTTAAGAAAGGADSKPGQAAAAAGAAAATPAAEPAGVAGAAPQQVTIEEFGRIQLRLAKVTAVEAHPKADKLYVIRLDAGELGPRQVVAGLKAYYKPEELVGQTVAFVANLKPAMLRGVESQGMILAADDGTNVGVLTPQRALAPGSRIR
ncbi:MAG TPA: methionine--tRNA ligase [Candidatus Thermoplasmatota archaeon]|nr:methionine--tRNA ligase [Candidatus Thermoplasmatota archaeon]